MVCMIELFALPMPVFVHDLDEAVLRPAHDRWDADIGAAELVTGDAFGREIFSECLVAGCRGAAHSYERSARKQEKSNEDAFANDALLFDLGSLSGFWRHIKHAGAAGHLGFG